MRKSRLKRGRIEIIEEEKMMIQNLDGQCRDTLLIPLGEAQFIRDEIGVGEEVLYFTQGNKLIHIEPERAIPELQELYRVLPKEIECETSVWQ
jgi:hypothetical protein